jgi:hypothetical protein
MAQSVTKYAEIQQDEIEALKSIYMEDFVEKETKTGAWNVGVSSSIYYPHDLLQSTSSNPFLQIESMWSVNMPQNGEVGVS